MLAINDHIIYESNGICKVVDIKTMKLGRLDEHTYFIIKQINNYASTFYLPVDYDTSTVNLRNIHTQDEILSLIDSMPDCEPIWVDNERERGKLFLSRIESNDCKEIIKVAKSIYLEKTKEKHRRANQYDYKIMGMAEKKLYEEIAFVLGIDCNHVIRFIENRLGDVAGYCN